MTALTRLSLANRLLVGMATVAIVVFGVLAALALRQELLPSTQVPTANLTARYPGASPEIVANEVAKPLGQAVSGISGVSKVRASSTNGLASFVIEWDYGLDNDKLVNQIRTAADGSQLPDAVTYDVMAGSTDDIPVLVLAVASDAKLSDLAQQVDEQVVPEIAGLSGVRRVDTAGQDVTQLRVTLRPKQLRAYDLSAAQVTQTLQSQASVIPAGNSYRGDSELAIQVGKAPVSARQVAGWSVPSPDGPVKLARIADVAVTSIDATTLARSGGRPAISINVLKESTADSVKLSHTIRDKLPAMTAALGNNAGIQIVFDQAPSIEESIHDLAVEGGLGLAFAVLIILVFLLSVRSTLITAISIPLSLMVAVIGLQVADYSLNIFTLAAMTVAVGRVVDDSIVVVENIKRHDVGPDPLTPATIIASVREVARAVTASTMTTVAVFLPVAIVSGITGELFRPFTLTVAIALVASLFVSMTIVPVLAYWFLRGGRRRAAAAGDPAAGAPDAALESGPAVEGDEGVTRLQRGYLPVLRFAMARPLVSLIVAFAIFAGTVGAATLLKTNFIDSFANKTSLIIDQELPVGTRLSTTSDAARQVESVLAATPGVKEYLTTIGQGGSNKVQVFVSLVDESAYEIAFPALETKLAALTGAGEVKIGSINTGTDNSLSYTVTGDDPVKLEAGASLVGNALRTTAGLTEVSTDLSDRRPQLDIEVNQRKAAALGFTTGEVGQAIGNALNGSKVGTIELVGKNRDIRVFTQDAGSASPAAVGALELPVSQLQQQLAIDKVTDRLKREGDRLKDRGDRLSDASEAVGDEQEALGERQQSAGEKQQDEALEAAAEARGELRDGVAKARDAVSSSKRQLAQVLRSEPTPPTDVPAVPVTADQLAYQQALAAWRAKVAQLQGAVAQGQGQVKSLAKQLDAALDQADKSAAQQRQSDGFADEQERLTNRQKDLGEQQKQLGEQQSDLAEEQSDIADLRAKPVRVRDVASVREHQAPSTVTQIDGTRAVTVTAKPENTDDLGALSATAQAKIDALDLPAGVSVETGGASEDQAEAFRQLGLAMLLAIVIVFLVMVATFRSIVQPLILLTAIPFAATGAVAGLLITDTPLGVPAMVGLLMLIGIVVTNAIVLIDLINTERARGEDVRSAVMHGARLRLRPIIMTATATIFALVPMALGLTGSGAFISKALAVVVIGGLVSSTALTLLLVPVLYTLVEGRRERRRHRKLAASPAPAPATGPA